jgi:branched-chain amino acid transport system permease protein
MFEPTILISVVATAMVYILAAFGLVVTYRVAGVFNLAFGYQAAFAAYLYWQFSSDSPGAYDLPAAVAAILVVFVFSPLIGLLLQQVLFRKRQEVLSAIIITLGLGVFITGLIQKMWPSDQILRTVNSVFGPGYWRVGNASITHNEVGVTISAAVIALGVYLLFSRSRTGMQMRAVVDDPELAGASGIPYVRMSAAAWMISSMLAGASGVLLAPALNLDVTLLSGLVVAAFAVAAFAGLASMGLAILGAFILAFASASVLAKHPFPWLDTGSSELAPFLMLALVLLIHPAAQRRVRVVGGGMRRALRDRASGNVSTALALVVVLTILGRVLNPSWAFTGQQVAAYGIAALSLVLLVGASGQISLAQVTFMGITSVAMGHLTAHGMPWGVALVIGVLASAVAGFVLSLAAFRLRGLFLALISYAFAYAALIVLFRNQDVISFAGLSVDRPSVFGVDMGNDRNFLYFAMAVLAICIVVVGGLLRGPWGRALQTLSAGDSVASVSGLPVRLWKMTVFTVSAALAGVAGGIASTSNITITGDSFLPGASIALLAFAVVGGITTPAGAVVAGFIAQAGTPIMNLIFANAGPWNLILFGIMAMDTTLRYPAGLGGMLPSKLPGIDALARRLRGRHVPTAPATGAS